MITSMQPQSQFSTYQPLPPGFGKPSKKPLVVAIILGVLLVLMSAIDIWAFIGMQENKSNLDAKIVQASAVAVEAAEKAKEVEFTEREKSPYKSYTGPETYGSVTFEYPKSWSVSADEAKSGTTALNIFAHPTILPSLTSSRPLAFRLQIVEASYEKSLASYNAAAKSGAVTIAAFSPEKLPQEVGVKISGQIVKERSGVLVMLPLRDKTIQLWTESNEFVPDLETLLKTLTYQP